MEVREAWRRWEQESTWKFRMPTTCQINFDNNLKKIFFAGQKLHITVRLKLTDEKIVRGISIHLRGTAHVRCFTKDEDVLDMTKCLAGDNGNNGILLRTFGIFQIRNKLKSLTNE